MCVYFCLTVYSCLPGYICVTAHVFEREDIREEGNYITNLPWLLIQFSSLLFSQSRMFDS